MKKYFSASVVREADRIAHTQLGLPGEILMENAGRGAAEIIRNRYPITENILIFCGGGNNGGDGFVTARHLSLMGFSVTVIATRDAGDYKNEASVAAVSAEKSGVTIFRSDRLQDYDVVSYVEQAGVVVDALLGTGAKGVPTGEVARLIKFISGHEHVVAFDIPSGVDADTGEIYGESVNAELTVTFLAEKSGLAIAPGMFKCGDVVVTGIGANVDIVLPASPYVVGYESSDIPMMSPAISPDIHKGSRGALLILGGSSNYRGAPVLSALAALKAGCGLVALAIPASLVPGASVLVPEAIFIPLHEKNGHITFKGFEETLAPYYERFDAMIFGPGLGRSLDAEKAARFVHEEWRKPLLIDADALHARYGRKRSDTVATPHAGEAAFILGTSPNEISNKRLASCLALAEIFGVALLKGPHTLISNGKDTRVILAGGPELATPGSGDVLSGIIGAYLASGMDPLDAATLGASIHAASGERLRKAGIMNGLLAREIAGY